MTDLNKIQSAQTIIVTDGVSQEAALGSSIPAGTEEGLIVRDACKGQQTSANSRPVVIASDQSNLNVEAAQNAVVTGTITTAASTVAAVCSNMTWATITIKGTYAGVNVSFQLS